MKPVSNDFRPSLRGIRQLTGIVEYETVDGNEIILTTEDNDEIISETNDLIVIEQSKIQVNPSSIKLINPIFDVELFKSVCTGLTIESEIKIPVKTKINAKIGVLVNGEYEFVEYKNYIINDVTYKADTKSYLINAYDKMLESMISYDENPLSITYPITVKNLIIKICQKLNWSYNLGTLINEDKIIDNDLYLGQKLTYRDILDDLSQVICANLMFNENEALFAKYVNAHLSSTLIPFTINNDVIINVSSLNEKNIITDADLKDRDVNLGEKYGPVNALTISDNDVVLNNLVDSASISQNGKTEFNIDGNRILISNSDRFIDNMFNFINGLNYYIYDIETVGLLTFEPLDNLLINHNGIYYNCLALYSDVKLTTGLTESSHADKPEINKSEYIANDVNEKRINNALINIDKANAQIVLKVDSNGKIAKIELNGNADDGDTITIDASQLNITASDVINILSGNSINLTSKNITINSTNFNVDSNGNMTANSGTFGGTVNTSQNLTVGNNAYIGQNQASSGADQKYIYLSENSYIRRIRSGGSESLSLNCNDFIQIKIGGNNRFSCGGSNSSTQISSDTDIYLNASRNIYETVQPIITSDKRLKKEIKDLDVSFINDLKIKEFEYKHLEGVKQIGLIAQDYIGKDYSKYFLNQDEKGYYSIAYGNITNALIKYCQDLNNKIEKMQLEIDNLKEANRNG